MTRKQAKRLAEIAADLSLSVSIRQDARRLLEWAVTRPSDFAALYREFLEGNAMTIYSQVRDQMGLNNDSQGDAGFLHALLTFADANPPGGGNTYTNIYKEVAHRFRNLNPHAVRKVEAMLADGERQYAAGRP